MVPRDGRLQVRETPDPETGPGELLLRTLSTAICESDVHFMDHPELAVDDPTGCSLYDIDRDIVLGHEFVGEVVGHGPGCTDQFAVGAHVTAMPVRLVDGGAGGMRIIGQHPEAQGSFAELLVVSEVAAKPVPGDVSGDAVALTDAFTVGEFYVRSAGMQPGEVAIVIGQDRYARVATTRAQPRSDRFPRRGAAERMLASLTRNQAVELFAQAVAAAMGPDN